VVSTVTSENLTMLRLKFSDTFVVDETTPTPTVKQIQCSRTAGITQTVETTFACSPSLSGCEYDEYFELLILIQDELSKQKPSINVVYPGICRLSKLLLDEDIHIKSVSSSTTQSKPQHKKSTLAIFKSTSEKQNVTHVQPLPSPTHSTHTTFIKQPHPLVIHPHILLHNRYFEYYVTAKYITTDVRCNFAETRNIIYAIALLNIVVHPGHLCRFSEKLMNDAKLHLRNLKNKLTRIICADDIKAKLKRADVQEYSNGKHLVLIQLMYALLPVNVRAERKYSPTWDTTEIEAHIIYRAATTAILSDRQLARLENDLVENYGAQLNK